MRQVIRPGALGRPRGIRWRGRWEGGSGWGIHVTPWLIHANVSQSPLKCCEVISLQLIKINEKKKFHAIEDQKKAGVAILKIDFKIKPVKRDKEGHYIMIKGSTQEEDITIINIYARNIGALQYVRQRLTRMKGEINNNTIIVGDFNTPLTPMGRSTKQKINKETQTLNDTVVHLDQIDIYRKFHPKTINFTFFSSTHGTFSRIDHMLGHKSRLGKLKKKKSEIIPVIFSDHNAGKKKKRTIKNSNIWRLNNMLLQSQQIIEEIKKESKYA